MKLKISVTLLLLYVFTTGHSFTNYDYQTKTDTSSLVKDKRTSILFGINFTHYTPTSQAKDKDWITAPFNLGAELLVAYYKRKNWSFYTGINYQYGKIAFDHHYYGDRTKFHEISVPFLTDLPSFKIFNADLMVRTGFYLGTYAKIKRETKGAKMGPDTNKWYDYPIDYKDDRFICDYYVGILSKKLSTDSKLDLELFLKHQLNKNYLSKDISRIIYGIKVKFKL